MRTHHFPTVSNVFPWGFNLPHRTSVAWGRSTAAFHFRRNVDFACYFFFCRNLRSRSFSGNRFLWTSGSRAGNAKKTCEPFISLSVSKVSSWGFDLPHRTSVARGRSTAAFHFRGNADFACYSNCFCRNLRNRSFSGNRSFCTIGSCAGNAQQHVKPSFP